MKVEVVEHRPTWQDLFKKEAARIEAILADEMKTVHHIGSTSVPGLRAKPIIDMLVVVKEISKVDLFNESFRKIGYEAMGEYGIPGRRYFRKGAEVRTFQIHIFEESNQKDIIRHLAVRDYLKTHEADAIAYGELKSRLAKQYPNDIRAYSEGKDAFVKDLEQKALAWYASQKTEKRDE